METKSLIINPGSTSTKIAYFENDEKIKEKNLAHSVDILSNFDSIYNQIDYRLALIKEWLANEKIKEDELTYIVARGGMLRPIPSGVYEVSDRMLEDLYSGVGGIHASNLGGILARKIGDPNKIKSYIVDPVSVDELDPISRISGLNKIERKSRLHALNIKAVVNKYLKEKNQEASSTNLIVAHLGGGISVCAIKKARIVDTNNANEMGPYSPERTGSLPVGDLVDLSYSGKYSYKEIMTMLNGKGGLISYLGTNDGRLIEEKLNKDNYVKLIYDAMIYQINKEIGSMASVLKGEVDGLLLTGGLSYSSYITNKIKDSTSFIGDIYIYPGENEMEALNQGVLRIYKGIESLKIYDEVVKNEKL